MKGTNDKYLIDYNYNIEYVMSSSTSQKVSTPLLVLELFLQVNQDEEGKNMGGKVIQRVIIEFDKEEMRDFIEKLESIEREVIALSGSN